MICTFLAGMCLCMPCFATGCRSCLIFCCLPCSFVRSCRCLSRFEPVASSFIDLWVICRLTPLLHILFNLLLGLCRYGHVLVCRMGSEGLLLFFLVFGKSQKCYGLLLVERRFMAFMIWLDPHRACDCCSSVGWVLVFLLLYYYTLISVDIRKKTVKTIPSYMFWIVWLFLTNFCFLQVCPYYYYAHGEQKHEGMDPQECKWGPTFLLW